MEQATIQQAVEHLTAEAMSFKDRYEYRIDLLEKAAARPPTGADFNNIHVLENPQMKAFGKYLRSGDDGELKSLQSKAMSVGSDPDGGYLVLPTQSSRMIERLFDTSPMRAVATVETISTDSLEMFNDVTELAASWTSEQGTRSNTNTSTLGKYNIPVHEVYASPKATQKLIDDSSINIESWLLGKVNKVFTRKENDAFINGNGVGKPRGFLTYTNSTGGDSTRTWGEIQYVPSGTSAVVEPDSLFDLMYALKSEYRPGASWLAPRALINSIRKKKTGTGDYIWQPALTAGEPDRLLGFPLMYAEDMPVAGASSLSVAFGNFREAYTIVDRQGIKVLRDPFTDKPNVIFYSTKRVGGAVVNFDAIKLLKLSAS